jgi:hypothetical protein
MLKNKIKAFAAVSAMAVIMGGQAAATPFAPVIDEFWIVKGDNGGTPTETFRDSFNDGNVPLSGPQDGANGNPDTYVGSGLAGFTNESGGKLTMTPSLGETVLIDGYLADTFTGATKLRSTLSGNLNSLELADSFEIHGLFDLSSLPGVSGQSFGIGVTDRAGTNGSANEGNDTIRLSVAKSSVTGNTIVRFTELDFINDTIEVADIVSIQAFLGTACQIELVLSKAAGTGDMNAYFSLFDSGGGLIHTSALLDNVGNDNGNTFAVYNGIDGVGTEDYTRAQFFAKDTSIPVPAPATALVLAAGVAGLGLMRRVKRA